MTSSSERSVLADGELPFDYLIVATGATHSYFGNDHWRNVAPGLKTVEEALDIRRRALDAFEQAESETDESRRRQLMTFVLIGGGPTGVELAGAISELANYTLRGNFRHIDTRQSRIVLIEAVDRLLTSYDERLSDRARQSLEKLNVEVRLGARVESIEADQVEIATDGKSETINAATIVWAAGVKASPLGAKLTTAANVEVDDKGYPIVNDDLSIGQHDNIFVAGDLAHCNNPDGSRLPGVAPVAMQQGKYLAKLIRRRLAGKSMAPFRYRDPGSMAVIGRSAAVAEIGRLKLHGLVAWLAWLFVHLINLVQFENRVLVLFQWAWNYTTRNRSARLITSEQPLPDFNIGDRDQKSTP